MTRQGARWHCLVWKREESRVLLHHLPIKPLSIAQPFRSTSRMLTCINKAKGRKFDSEATYLIYYLTNQDCVTGDTQGNANEELHTKVGLELQIEI